ncbi:MAG: bifunctional heptose 7-phosphate kinase/heptose 1-phosphate adenyltransferase [Planctomycetes bacterium]|nr:bifunctional heptose 7-phosphate kinase/heptose 1-phosphate adenyltransferase [Planctomycetota bacterium]
MSTLLHKLTTFRPFTAMVVGDYMLDQHQYGAAERLSPDAPVPVLHASRTEDRPGGAANVALCVRALRGEVRCVGVVGDDVEGRRLRDALAAEGCDVEGMLTDDLRPTTIKRSFVGLAQHRHPQKMFRVDVESRDAIADALAERLAEHVAAHLDEVDVVCLEDYDKGVCSPTLCRRIIERCRERGKPVIIDPAAIEDYDKYRGATAITPNRSEAELATGLDTPIDASQVHNAGLAAALGRALDLDAVVLTLDRHGALLEERGGDPIVVPTVARSVYDVTGAGDVVLAALAAARANGFTWHEAVEFANAAAGLEVEVFGARPIPLAHVQREILARSRSLSGKVRTVDELLVELAVHREAGHRIVFTNGCFDVIHAGHVTYLRDARQQGDLLVVAVNSDAQVRAQKGEGRPIYAIGDRLDILAELNCVDYLVVFEEPTVDDLLRALRPEVYVKGGDYQPDDINEIAVVRELGLELRVLAHRPGLGSTDVIERMARASGQ